MAAIPFFRGRNSKLFLNINSSGPLIVASKSFAVDENVTEPVDDVNGEDASRPDIVHNFWELGFNLFQRDMSIFNAWLLLLAAEVSQTAPLVTTCGITYNMRNGTKQSYMLTQCTRRAAKIDASARGDAVMFPSGFRARYMKPTQ